MQPIENLRIQHSDNLYYDSPFVKKFCLNSLEDIPSKAKIEL
jgi:hypothetical protein